MGKKKKKKGQLMNLLQGEKVLVGQHLYRCYMASDSGKYYMDEFEAPDKQQAMVKLQEKLKDFAANIGVETPSIIKLYVIGRRLI